MMLAKSLQSAAGNAAGEANYIEDVFSTYLYIGNGSTQTITNGIDLAGEGGMVWVKSRSNATYNCVVDTARFVSSSNTKMLFTDQTFAEDAAANEFGSFNSNGFSIPYNTTAGWTNFGTRTFTSWTFRKQPKFFDVVTWTGNGVNGRAIPHSLGSVPGCIMVKRTDTTGNWQVYHRSAAADPSIALLVLNTTAAVVTDGNVWWSTPPTSTEFTVGGVANVNASGGTYVAYLFAHNAGGFGLTGEDNVISCGSYTGNGSATGPVIDLGYEPQWVMIKCASDVSNWSMIDNMRGWNVIDGAANVALLSANLSSAEVQSQKAKPLSTGFQINDNGSAVNTSGATYIYIAIRRGPMKVPESGTSVFAPIASGDSTGTKQTTGFPIDAQFISYRFNNSNNTTAVTRLTGANSPNLAIAFPLLVTSSTNPESTAASRTNGWNNTGFLTPSAFADYSAVYWSFGRAPSFYDTVCYTSVSGVNTRNHNLAAVPELMFVKFRSSSTDWYVYYGNSGRYLKLNSGLGFTSDTTIWNNTTPTATTFQVGGVLSSSGDTVIAHLFASCPGVSKVGTYTGNDSSQTINCGFTSGARFFLVKRIEASGDWYVFDSARGIVGAGDPFLRWNLTNGEQSGADAVDADSSGIIVNQEATCNINVNGATYIYLGIS